MKKYITYVLVVFVLCGFYVCYDVGFSNGLNYNHKDHTTYTIQLTDYENKGLLYIQSDYISSMCDLPKVTGYDGRIIPARTKLETKTGGLYLVKESTNEIQQLIEEAKNIGQPVITIKSNQTGIEDNGVITIQDNPLI